MRPRKAAVAVSLEEMPPRDDVVDALPLDEATPPDDDDAGPLGRICIACGGEAASYEGCDHAEMGELREPSRAAREAVARVRRAAAEHRAAARALRVLVLSEMARGRADLQTIAPQSRDPAPCPRCALRDAEAAAAASGVTAPRPARRKGRPGATQQSLPFAGDPAPE
jgi:hypothetical protein